MKIDSNPNSRPIEPARPAKAALKREGASDTEFARANALEHALQTTPDIRPEAVARAATLVADASYPPLEVIERIARLVSGENEG